MHCRAQSDKAASLQYTRDSVVHAWVQAEAACLLGGNCILARRNCSSVPGRSYVSKGKLRHQAAQSMTTIVHVPVKGGRERCLWGLFSLSFPRSIATSGALTVLSLHVQAVSRLSPPFLSQLEQRRGKHVLD